MKRLYYSKFEKGFGEVVKAIIKKQDKSAVIKKLFDDSVLFFADEHFKTDNLCFKSSYMVIDSIQKEGLGGINAAMKHLLEKKNLKISFPKNVSSFKLVFLKENDKVLIDANLKKAVEIMLKKVTKKAISYMSTEAELNFLAKQDGTILFMKKVGFLADYQKVESKSEIAPDVAYLLNFLSEAEPEEVSLDPFAQHGMISFVRALSFKKSNVIANDKDKENVSNIKTKLKFLKENKFSVLNYDFLDEKFPIRFIDKIVTCLPQFSFDDKPISQVYHEFFEKAFKLNIKVIVLLVDRGFSASKYVYEKYNIEKEIITKTYKVLKLKIIN